MPTFMTKSIRRAMVTVLLTVPALTFACTNLTEVPRDALTPANAFKTDAEVLAGVASVYAGLRGTMWGYYNLSEVSTDEMIVPTRGQDWFDNGRWLEIYKQTWSANSGSALDDMNGVWNDMFSGVARANLLIEVINTAGGANKAETLAELRTLRAWYYYVLQDFFGGVPLVTDTKVEKRARVSRDSIYRFLITELNAARTALPETRPAGDYGRITRGAANAILANLYVNAQVFGGTVTASGLTKGPARWQDAIDAADRVINSGKYTLNPNWRKNFTPDNEGSPENIFVIAHSATDGLGMNLPMRTLHYNQLSVQGGPWNGFATIADTYRAFDPADQRRGIFLVGQQSSFDTNLPVKDRAGNPLIFTETIGSETAANEAEGPRFNKFVPLPTAPSGSGHPNDFPYFRLAEMYLIKAEALNELGNFAGAATQVNIVRNRQFATPTPVVGTSQAQMRQVILQERLFEFVAEGKRRQDLIRNGSFTDARRFKVTQQAYKVLFPIPLTQIQTNPLLQQNAGY